MGWVAGDVAWGVSGWLGGEAGHAEGDAGAGWDVRRHVVCAGIVAAV